LELNVVSGEEVREDRFLVKYLHEGAYLEVFVVSVALLADNPKLLLIYIF
jgi:hypothetical protein